MQSLTGHIDSAGGPSRQLPAVGEVDPGRPQDSAEPFFGRFLGMAGRLVAAGGSELGLGVSLFALAVSINAANIIEIGRFKGFSTLCLASALRYLDLGWHAPAEHRQRPDIDYDELERPKRRKLISIDPFPTSEAADLIASEGLATYVEFVNRRSCEISVCGQADLIFIDGDHSYEGCRRDVEHYIPQILRPGGYFVLHDYFGWYDENRINRSPIKAVIDELSAEQTYQHLLFDTGYMSFVIFRKCPRQGP